MILLFYAAATGKSKYCCANLLFELHLLTCKCRDHELQFIKKNKKTHGAYSKLQTLLKYIYELIEFTQKNYEYKINGAHKTNMIENEISSIFSIIFVL